MKWANVVVSAAFVAMGASCGGPSASSDGERGSERESAAAIGRGVEACPDIYGPVCGDDGITYANDCFAEQAGTDVACEGECPCASSGGHAPVSSKDGGLPPMACPEIYGPVCGADGVTYANDCFANAATVAIACEGECPCGPSEPGPPEDECSLPPPTECVDGSDD